MSEFFSTKALYSCDIPWLSDLWEGAEYPWELLPRIGPLAQRLVEEGIPGFERIAPGVLAGPGVTVATTATLIGPAVLGPGTEVRPGAYLRGKVLAGPECVIGNSTELKNCLLLRRVQVPHYNYVGDSVLGNFAHMGAGSICSNLRSDGQNVVIRGEKDHSTGMRKVGAFLGDGADVGCGCVLNPGTVIGCRSSVYPLTALRGVYPPDHIIKSTSNYVPRAAKIVQNEKRESQS